MTERPADRQRRPVRKPCDIRVPPPRGAAFGRIPELTNGDARSVARAPRRRANVLFLGFWRRRQRDAPSVPGMCQRTPCSSWPRLRRFPRSSTARWFCPPSISRGRPAGAWSTARRAVLGGIGSCLPAGRCPRSSIWRRGTVGPRSDRARSSAGATSELGEWLHAGRDREAWDPELRRPW